MTTRAWPGRRRWPRSPPTCSPLVPTELPEVGKAADRLVDELESAGVDVLYDDRDTSPGVKFADADLLGLPVRLVVGSKGLARGIVEWRDRRTGDEREVDIDDVAAQFQRG